MAVSTSSPIERAIAHDRAWVACSLGALTLLSAVYLIRMAGMMNAAAADKAMHAAMGMPEMAAWGATEFVMLFLMWSVMMMAMMLRRGTVILLIVGTFAGAVVVNGATAEFTIGICWLDRFSAFAALAQLELHRTAMLSQQMATNSAIVGRNFNCCGSISVAAAESCEWLNALSIARDYWRGNGVKGISARSLWV